MSTALKKTQMEDKSLKRRFIAVLIGIELVSCGSVDNTATIQTTTSEDVTVTQSETETIMSDRPK